MHHGRRRQAIENVRNRGDCRVLLLCWLVPATRRAGWSESQHRQTRMKARSSPNEDRGNPLKTQADAGQHDDSKIWNGSTHFPNPLPCARALPKQIMASGQRHMGHRRRGEAKQDLSADFGIGNKNALVGCGKARPTPSEPVNNELGPVGTYFPSRGTRFCRTYRAGALTLQPRPGGAEHTAAPDSAIL